MNEREELRVVEALQALTGGLTVTEQDMLIANSKLKENLGPPSPRRRIAAVAIVAAAAALAGFVIFQATDDNTDNSAPPVVDETSTAADELVDTLEPNAYNARDFSDGAPPTAEDLTGIWLLRPPYPGALIVNGNGSWSYESLRSQDMASSTLDGRTWTRNLDGGPCSVGGGGQPDALPWTASIAGDGSLHLAFTGVSNVCTPADAREVWDRLVPGPSPVMDFLRDTSDQIEWQTPTDWEWPGLYVDPATGHVLEMAEDGSYRYFRDLTGNEFNPAREDALDTSDATQPGIVSGSCGEGHFTQAHYEVGQTPEVEDYILARDAVKITPTAAGCSQSIAGIWVRIS